MSKPFIQQETESILTKYPQVIELSDRQLDVFWLPGEINVEKDVQSIKTEMTDAERHGVLTTLRLFTLYELRAGADYWGERFTKIFPRPEFRRMASTFSMFELSVHAPFYNKLNEALNVSTDDFYLSYVKTPVLKERMDFVDGIINGGDDLYSIGVFSIIEGAVLYSAFAYLKHFQANGKNKLNNVCRGIDFSVRDEAIHSNAGALCFQLLKGEKELKPNKETELKASILYAAEKILEHEYQIIDMIFEKGPIDGISKESLKTFVYHRVHLCLQQLGIIERSVDSGPVGEWFYKSINDYKFNDFFAGVGNEYRRDWDEKRFVW